jgi:RHS repeat-associated protein
MVTVTAENLSIIGRAALEMDLFLRVPRHGLAGASAQGLEFGGVWGHGAEVRARFQLFLTLLAGLMGLPWAGAALGQYEYDPYGNRVQETGVRAEQNPFAYAGKYLDRETGLINFGFRYYSPELGRWLGRDPLGEAGGLNLYGFNHNSPLNYFDPFGLQAEDLEDLINSLPNGGLSQEMKAEYDSLLGELGDTLGESAVGVVPIGRLGPLLPKLRKVPRAAEQAGDLTQANKLKDAVQKAESTAKQAAQAGKGCDLGAAKSALPVPRGKAPEFPSGQISESGVLRQAQNYLGPGYKEVSPGRYVSADGTRQFRYGAHETRNSANHHAHFESLEDGRVTENAVVKIVPDP